MTLPARPEQQAAVLGAALARARAAAPAGVVVFDLDSTLLDNRPRQARILQDYGRAAGLPELLGARPEHWQDWSLEAALRNAGLPPALVEQHLAPARAFWRTWFFTSAYCRLDAPVPGAAAYVREVAGAGAQVAYVTGRPRTMEEGTREAFRRHGFPAPDGARIHLHLKPAPDLHDDLWKAQAVALIDRLGPVVAAFDNERTHANGYAAAWPEALVVRLERDDSGRPVELLARIPSVRDFTLG